MQLSQVAAQCYTIRDFCKDAAAFAVSMRKVKGIGYAAVQISGVGPIPEAEVVRIVTGEGLKICATHESGQAICDDTQQVIDRLGKLGTPYTAYPWPHVPLETIEQVRALAKSLDRAGAVMRAAGQVLTYHNHQIEFKRIAGRTVLDILFDETDPRNLQGELDTYWVQTGGGEPTAWCAKLKNRLPLLHLKDYAIGANHAAVMAEIGSGNLDWARIVAAAEQSGCRWFIVEQDVCPGDPFASLKTSFDWIAANLVGQRASAGR
ncbi:MAG: sugar phosphate isomerase/epimerase [Planctomycetes bacterium]|nr:sugar phosphate isomerase/epimerase [Planctomycetota bacterium]